MGWHKIPEFDSVSSSDDNSFAGSQVQPTGKVSLKLPVDDCMLIRKTDVSTVCSWSPEPAKLNSALSRVARRSLPAAPPSRPLSQDILRRWKRAAREQTVLCNQGAGLSRGFN